MSAWEACCVTATLHLSSNDPVTHKDQMVEEEQERRERMHEAVDQIEDSSDSVAW
jgi:hypothetical protein